MLLSSTRALRRRSAPCALRDFGLLLGPARWFWEVTSDDFCFHGTVLVGLTKRVLFWSAAVILGVSGLYGTYAYVATLATSDLHGRCQEVYLEQFWDGEVLAVRRQWFPPAIGCTVRYRQTGEVDRQTRPSEATSFFVLVMGVDLAAVALVATGCRSRARRG